MFTHNATYNFVTGSTDNIETLKKTIRDALSPLTTSQHINNNQWAEIEGDLAKAGCYFTVHSPDKAQPCCINHAVLNILAAAH